MDQINTFYDLDTGVLQVLDLEYLLETFPEDAFTAKYKQLNTALTGLVSDYRYFTPLVTLVVWLVTPSPDICCFILIKLKSLIRCLAVW